MTVLLYRIFKPVNKTNSAIAAYARLAMTTMIGMNILNKLIVLHLLSAPDYLSVFNQNQINALVLVFLNAYSYVSLHLFLIRHLIVKSTFFPKLLGFLFYFAAAGYILSIVLDISFFPSMKRFTPWSYYPQFPLSCHLLYGLPSKA